MQTYVLYAWSSMLCQECLYLVRTCKNKKNPTILTKKIPIFCLTSNTNFPNNFISLQSHPLPIFKVLEQYIKFRSFFYLTLKKNIHEIVIVILLNIYIVFFTDTSLEKLVLARLLHSIQNGSLCVPLFNTYENNFQK